MRAVNSFVFGEEDWCVSGRLVRWNVEIEEFTSRSFAPSSWIARFVAWQYVRPSLLAWSSKEMVRALQDKLDIVRVFRQLKYFWNLPKYRLATPNAQKGDGPLSCRFGPLARAEATDLSGWH